MSVIIPPWVEPRNESHEWMDELSTVFQPEFAPGATQRQSYGSCRLRINREHTVRGEELAVLESTLLSADGRFATVYARAPHRPNTGTFPTTELLTNNTFASGTTGFTPSSGELVLSVLSRALRIRRASVIGVADVVANPITVSAAAEFKYVFRIFLRQGRGAINCSFRFGSTSGGAEHGSATATTPGLHEIAIDATTTTLYVSIRDNPAGRAAEDYYDVPFISVSRCLYVDGASQTGSSLNVINGSSGDGVLMPGDWVGVGRQTGDADTTPGVMLSQVTQGLSLSSTFQGTMFIKPQLFTSPSDASAIVCYRPLGKFLVSDLRIKNRFGVEADISYILEQLYD